MDKLWAVEVTWLHPETGVEYSRIVLVRAAEAGQADAEGLRAALAEHVVVWLAGNRWLLSDEAYVE